MDTIRGKKNEVFVSQCVKTKEKGKGKGKGKETQEKVKEEVKEEDGTDAMDGNAGRECEMNRMAFAAGRGLEQNNRFLGVRLTKKWDSLEEISGLRIPVA